MLKIITYNIYSGKEVAKIAEWLKSADAKYDILCFQEFPKDAIETFLKSFPKNYQYEYAKSFETQGKEFGELTIFNANILKLLYTEIVPLGKEPLFKFVKFNVDRTSLITMFCYQKKEITIANSHLTWFAFNTYRISQIKKIIDRVSNLKCPAIILGDFNYSSHFGKKRLIKYMKKNNFQIALDNVITHTIKPLYKRIPLRLFRHQLDYVFYKECKVGNTQILRVPFSDHMPTASVIII